MLHKHPLSLPGFLHFAEIEKRESSSSSSSVKQEKVESLFTAGQLQELYYQTLIFNCIVYGLPLPFHLLLPIRPSSTGSSTRDSDNEIMTDPQPERCRRTDGRKWRCSKNVLPNEKYCERHMHRGRKRSRKHVECSTTPLQPNDETLTSNDGVMPITSPNPIVELKKSIMEDEPHRCKRTDGKRWRCGKEVIPGQNYCETHVHRGVKRVVLDSELAQFTAPRRHSSINLNAEPALSPREVTESKSSRSSDATVTDENISTCNTLVRSP